MNIKDQIRDLVVNALKKLGIEDINNIKITTGLPIPTLNQYRVVVMGI
jgi:hypothetical protein